MERLPMLKPMIILAALLCTAPAVAQTRMTVITDGSGTIATAATSQRVFDVDSQRTWMMCQNPIAATEPLLVGIGASASQAANPIELAPGGIVGFTGLAVPTTAINVSAATVGHRFICKVGN